MSVLAIGVLGVVFFNQIALADHLVPPAIFEDGFELGDFSSWTSAGGNWDTINNPGNAHTGSYRADVKGGGGEGDGILLKEVSTEGQKDIELSFYFYLPSSSALEDGDYVKTEWTSDGATWDEIYTITNEFSPDTWHNRSNGFGEEANNNPNFAFRVVSNLNAATSDVVRFDDFLLTGVEIVEKSISGTKWNDLNGDGVRNWEDDDDNGEKDEDEEYTESGIGGWTMMLYSYGYEEYTETVTGPDGAYSFSDLENDDYIVCEKKKSGDSDDWMQTFPNKNSDDGAAYDIYGNCDEEGEDYEKYGYEVSIGDVVNVSNLDFGNRESAHIVVRKTTYPESGQEFNFSVAPYDDDGGIDTGAVEFSAAHGDEGRTIDVAPGIYDVREVVPDEWKLSHVFCEYDGSAVGEDRSDGKTVTVGAGDTVTCTFTNIGADITIVTGYKWEDMNGDGSKDENEPGRKDWNMALGRIMPRDTGVVTIPIEIVALSLTGADGWYYVPVTEQGDYQVFEEKRAGWSTTNPAAVDSFFDITYRIDGAPQLPLAENSFFDVFVAELRGQTIAFDANEHLFNFGNFKHGTVSGYKWEDLNSDGEWNNGEEGKDGWIMALGRILPRRDDGSATIPIEIIAMSLTGEGGAYSLSVNRSGEYKVFEEKREGWSATNPVTRTDSFFDITYDLNAIAAGDPDFDLLRVTGDPDFDLLRSSFFDVFVEVSGEGVSQSKAVEDGLTTIPGVPLRFGNHKLLVINKEEITATEVKETSTVITWTTDFPGTSRVVYGTVSQPVLGSAPNYGYANSTVVSDEDPKVTNHSVSISGLDSGATYYYRTISAASPESVSGENSFSTPTPSSGGGGSGGGGGGSSSGGGGGGGIVILPGTSQPETNAATPVEHVLENLFASVPVLGGSAQSGASAAPLGGDAAAHFLEESGAVSGSSENADAGMVVTDEALPLQEPSSAEQSASFFAAAIAALSFGTQSSLLALATVLSALSLLVYGGYWMNQKKTSRKR